MKSNNKINFDIDIDTSKMLPEFSNSDITNFEIIDDINSVNIYDNEFIRLSTKSTTTRSKTKSKKSSRNKLKQSSKNKFLKKTKIKTNKSKNKSKSYHMVY